MNFERLVGAATKKKGHLSHIGGAGVTVEVGKINTSL